MLTRSPIHNRSFIIGSLPLSFALSSSQLRFISSLGVGVLIGTSLVVIVPEGVDTLYNSISHKTVGASTSPSSVAANAVPAHHTRGLYVSTAASKKEDADLLRRTAPLLGFTAGQGVTEEDAAGKRMDHERTRTASPNIDAPTTANTRRQAPPNEKETESSSPHAWTGIALVSGFLFMYLIDKTAQYTSFASQKPRPHHISLDNLASALGRLSSSSGSSGLPTASNQSSLSASTSAFSSFTLGLVIHALSDGIALGASSTSPSLSFIIFFALLIHKAPAAFGLSTILLQHTSLSYRAVRTHLAIFSLASPVGAVMTWLVAHTLLASHVVDESSNNFWTGVLLLFSAGTFLYVAVHAMHEHDRGSSPSSATSGASAGPTSLLMSGGLRRDSLQMNDFGDSVMPSSSSSSAPGKPRIRDWVASVIGMLLPLFLQIGHAH